MPAPSLSPHRVLPPGWRAALLLALPIAVALAVPGTAVAQLRPAVDEALDMAAASRALERAALAVVAVEATAVDGARSARTLGSERRGSGVVIGEDDLVLTIGYLVLEAEQVALVTDDGRRVPARVVAYDLATGFGLVQALAPLRIAPVPLGRAAALARGEGLMVASGGLDGAVSPAALVSRRGFSGSWEYHVDEALFTTPPRSDHSGAALVNARGELVGIGSLVVQDAAGPEQPRIPGNMFVPVDLLPPILAELRAQGRSAGSARPWLGLNCIERDGQVIVARINEDSPADVAGLQRGDRILAIDGTAVDGLERLWKTLWARQPPEREVRLEILRDGRPETLSVYSVDRAKTLRRPAGV